MVRNRIQAVLTAGVLAACMQRIAGEYGIPFLNLNHVSDYETMGLDFSKDFYDGKHTNLTGSKKVTEYLADYLDAQYDLPDRREDPAFQSWSDDYQTYLSDFAALTAAS